jgi:ion channel POLLUX/CASTOR
MSRGTVALIGGLFIVSLLIILLISLVLAFSGTLLEHESTRGIDLIELLWLSLLRTLDPGTMGADVGTIPFVLAMLAVTLGGIFIISTLIGVISTGIEGKLAELRKGHSQVIESDHAIILGWSPQVFSIVAQLAAANAARGDNCVALLADRDKVEMEDEIRARVPNLGRTRVVCRRGSPMDLNQLDIVSPQTSRSIIVLSPEHADPDAEVLKTLLAITNSPNRRPEPYHVVAQIHDPRNVDVARLASRGEARVVLVGDLIGRIAAQTCRQPGLSSVYMELLDFGGDEIYFASDLGLAGSSFGEAMHAFGESCLIGIVPSEGPPLLNPPMERLIEPGERLIFVAPDEDSIRRTAPPAGGVREERIRRAASPEARQERTLVLGWNRRTPAVLLELDRYVAAGSEVALLADGPDVAAGVDEVRPQLHRQTLSFVAGDTSDRRVLDSLGVERYDHVVIMAYSEQFEEQRADARTLVTLLHLRDIAARASRRFSIVSEMLDLRNRQLAKATRADDFIVSDKLVSLTVSQLAQNPELQAVFDELFDVEGSEIYLRLATDYVDEDGPVDFYTIVEAGRRRGEVCLGYRLMADADDPGRSYGVRINPPKDVEISLGPDDRLIVLARD